MSQRIERQTKSQDSKTLTRHWDAFGRNVGYSVDGDRKQSITYNSAIGRIAESDGFRWDYLAGSNLKSSLTYPNDAVVTWSYEPHRDLLTAVTNDTHSAYVYANDLLGRRVFKNDEHYGYNVRNELTSANAVSYAYDDIGNRTVAEGKTYTANNLNQYTQIDGFTPEYDADGNQTLIKTSTGIWSVTYNAENRPVRWQSGDTVITMAFDRMGRRVEMRTVKDSEETLQRFVYDNYLCVQQLRGADNALFHSYVWDPTEPIATRPLIFLPSSGILSYYFHDGNKNVSDLVDSHGSVVHYDYTPFGTPTIFVFSENPFCFSSEYYDWELRVSHYNYRHYLHMHNRWTTRDPFYEMSFVLLFKKSSNKYFYALEERFESYIFLRNMPLDSLDLLGLSSEVQCGNCRVCLDPDRSGGKSGGYHVHWNCNRKTHSCRGGGTASWPSGEGREGSSNLPDKIRECIEQKTTWAKRPITVSVPLEDGECCNDESYEEYFETGKKAIFVTVTVVVVWKTLKACGGGVVGFFVAGPPGAIGGVAVGLAL